MGLVRGMARTAVVAGTATAVSNRVSRRQDQEYAQQAEYAAPPQPAAPAPAPPAAGTGSDALTAEIERLAALRSQGLLTAEEFAAAKAKLLGL